MKQKDIETIIKKGAFFHVWKKSKEKQNVKYSLFYSYTILIIIRR